MARDGYKTYSIDEVTATDISGLATDLTQEGIAATGNPNYKVTDTELIRIAVAFFKQRRKMEVGSAGN